LIFRESEKELKDDSIVVFFSNVSLARPKKEINYHSKDALSNLLTSGKLRKIT
jgi:hypothetical protein